MIIKRDKDTIQSYFEDSSNLKGGYADEVVIPSTTDEIIAYVKESHKLGRPILVSGGGTATTGARVPFGGAVLSMERFNRIISIDSQDMACVILSGVLVEALKNAVESKGLFYTSHPTENTAFVGGTIATNASGARSFKYGPIRAYVKSLSMILADGTPLTLRRGEKKLTHQDSAIELPGGRRINIPIPSYKMPSVKSAAGYFAYDGVDAIDLFIGQEGTLSIITEAEIALVKRPKKIIGAFVFFDTEAKAWDFADMARKSSRSEGKRPGGIDALSIEYFDNHSLDLLRSKTENVPGSAKSAIFFEQESSDALEDAIIDAWTSLIERAGSSDKNTWVAFTEEEHDKFLGYRHMIPSTMNELIRRSGFQKISTDCAVPESSFFEIMNFYRKALNDGGIGYYVFGHIGECHLHVNIFPKTEEELLRAREIYMAIVKKVVSLGGTVSAEHGIGKLKQKYLEVMYGAEGIADMAAIKRSLDPKYILGRGNILSYP